MKAVCVFIFLLSLFALTIAYPTNDFNEIDEFDALSELDEPQGDGRNAVLIALVQMVLHKSCFYMCDESMPFLENYVSPNMRTKLGDACKKLTKHVVTMAFNNNRGY